MWWTKQSRLPGGHQNLKNVFGKFRYFRIAFSREVVGPDDQQYYKHSTKPIYSNGETKVHTTAVDPVADAVAAAKHARLTAAWLD